MTINNINIEEIRNQYETDSESEKEFDIKEALGASRLATLGELAKILDVVDFNQMYHDYEKEKKITIIENRQKPDLTIADNIEITTETGLSTVENHLSVISDRAYYKGADDHWHELEKVNYDLLEKRLGLIFKAICGSHDVSHKASKMVAGYLLQPHDENDIVQFDDCYFDKSTFKKGVSQHGKIPKFRVKYSLLDAVENGKPIAQSEEVDELLLHIANYDEQTKKRLIESFSLTLLSDNGRMSSLSRMIRLFGPSGANGKSTLMNLMTQTLGEDNVTTFSSHELKNYTLAKVVESMLAYDDDERSSRIPDDASNNIKSIVTGDRIEARKIRGNPIDVKPTVQLVSLSNSIPKSEDKSSGFSRRLDWYKIDDMLEKEDAWFDRLFSDESKQYLMELLITTLIEVLNRKPCKLTPKSENMLQTEKQFIYDNNSALSFIEEKGRDWFIDRTVRSVKDSYIGYCEDNDLDELKGKFTSTIENKLNLVRKTKKYNTTKNYHEQDRDYYEKLVISMMPNKNKDVEEFSEDKTAKVWTNR